MHPTISYYLAQARMADLRHQAQRYTLARAAHGLGRRCRPGLHPWLLRWTRAVPGTVQAVQPAVAGDAPAGSFNPGAADCDGRTEIAALPRERAEEVALLQRRSDKREAAAV